MYQTQTINRGVYVVFLGTKQTQATFHKRKAIQFAKKNPGAEVYGMPRCLYKDGQNPYGWDGPTFRICAKRIFAS